MPAEAPDPTTEAAGVIARARALLTDLQAGRVAAAEPERAIVLVAPYAERVARGEKTLVIRAKRYELAGERLWLADADKIHGVVELGAPDELDPGAFQRRQVEHRISGEDREKFWPGVQKLFAYGVKAVEPLVEPRPYALPTGGPVPDHSVEYKRGHVPHPDLVLKIVALSAKLAGVLPAFVESSLRFVASPSGTASLLRGLPSLARAINEEYGRLGGPGKVEAVAENNPFKLADRLGAALRRARPDLESKTKILALTEDAIVFFGQFDRLEEDFRRAEDGQPIGKRLFQGSSRMDGVFRAAGTHVHTLQRHVGTTRVDGAHQHAIKVQDRLIWTEIDGPHQHSLEGEALRTTTDGAHRHLVRFPDGTELWTEVDGAHDHDLTPITTGIDGSHVHVLKLEGREARTVTSHEFSVSMTPPAVISLGPSPSADLIEKVLSDHVDADDDEQIPIAKPFAGFSDFASCVRAMRGKGYDEDRARRICGALQRDYEKNAGDSLAKTAPPRGPLPALKMPDPPFLLGRLRDEKGAGLLSRKPRRARIGLRQFLVNEIEPEYGAGSDESGGAEKKASVWGVITLGEPVEYEDLAAVPAEVRAGLDRYTLAEFSAEAGPVFYIPIELVAAYDPPIDLKRPPRGRRFAESVRIEEARA